MVAADSQESFTGVYLPVSNLLVNTNRLTLPFVLLRLTQMMDDGCWRSSQEREDDSTINRRSSINLWNQHVIVSSSLALDHQSWKRSGSEKLCVAVKELITAGLNI